MPEFANPLFLLLLPAVPLVLWLRHRRRRPALRYSCAELFADLPVRRRRGRVLLALEAVGLAALVAALAGPRWPDRSTRLPTEGIALMLLVDVSGSMGTDDFDWPAATPDQPPQRITRLEAVKRAFHRFVAGGPGPDGRAFEGRPRDLIGLIVFATWVDDRSPLTLVHSVPLGQLDQEEPRSTPTTADTNIGDAIAAGLLRLEAAAGGRRKVMVLLSDGEQTVPSPPALTPIQAARAARVERVPVYTIDAGGPPERLSGEDAAKREVGRQTLEQVADRTGGRYFPADDTAGLLRACQDIDRLERREIASFQYRRYHEAGAWCGLAAFVALALAWLLEQTRYRRLP